MTILQRLEELGFIYSREQSRQTDAAYSQVFLDIGINIDAMPVEEAGRRIRSHLTWKRLAEALDSWAGVRHEMQFIENRFINGDAPRRKRRVLQVARAADADDLRSQARLAVEKWDLQAAEQMAASPVVTRLPASTLRQLAMVIYWGGGESRRESATRLLVNAQFQRPDDFRLNQACANYYAQMAQPRSDQAIPYLRAALALRPRSSAVHNSLGAELCDDKQEYDQALAHFDRAIQLKPDFAMAHSNRGLALGKKGFVDKAIAACKQAIAIDPQVARSHSFLGVVLCDDKRDYDQAIACFDRAIQLKPDYAEAHSNRGVALGKKGFVDKAIVAHNQAIALDPKDCAVP